MREETAKSVMAGMAIALGCCLYLLAPNSIIGALLFSCGLLCVRIYKLNLFTGKIQFIGTKEYTPWFYLRVLLCNFFGAACIAAVTFKLTHDAAAALMTSKIAQPFLIALIKGIGCGMLMSLATYKDSPLWICLLCVPAFILAGFNHCIADAYYIIAGWNISWGFVATILGNILGGMLLSNYNVVESNI